MIVLVKFETNLKNLTTLATNIFNKKLVYDVNSHLKYITRSIAIMNNLIIK